MGEIQARCSDYGALRAYRRSTYNSHEKPCGLGFRV